MEELESKIAEQKDKYKLGKTQCLEELRKIADEGKRKGGTPAEILGTIERTGRITAYCANPYAALLEIREAYKSARNITQAQGIVAWLHASYELRKIGVKKKGGNQPVFFTTPEISELIELIKEES